MGTIANVLVTWGPICGTVVVAGSVGATRLDVSTVEPVVAEPEPFCVESPLLTTMVNVPVEPLPVGVPLMTPVDELKLRPAGRVPV